ncbi:hypothetical protein [Streptomyces sp. NPDC085540]|uniref:hypothetical protein n=1 Tax=Streptomyces sp. NPDC085540 TaxID=3365730 RepID=UPI0037D5B4EC
MGIAHVCDETVQPKAGLLKQRGSAPGDYHVAHYVEATFGERVLTAGAIDRVAPGEPDPGVLTIRRRAVLVFCDATGGRTS